MLSGRNKRILQSPIIGRVVELNKYIIAHGVKAPKLLQHHYICKMWDKGAILFEYARRQLLGKDYVRRTVELCEEIEAYAYLVATLGGWNPEVAGNINVMTEDIISQVEAHGQNHKPVEVR